jgi:uncharacterized protein
MDKKTMGEIKPKFENIIPLLKKENFDMIIAINRGGVIPAGIINQSLNLPLDVININYRDEKNMPKYDSPKMMSDFKMDIKKKKVLIVDDVSRTGKTLELAKKYLGENSKTFVINGKADYNLYDEECFIMPWVIK